METTSSIQLQFRSGDDLFNNYGIGIIRQVVDKSENIIQQKREEMRQLVGGKYLDMLQVSDTILTMNKEFSNINSSVNNILSVCNSIDREYVYNSEERYENLDGQEITPESLWSAYDNNNLLQLSKDLLLFKNQQNASLSFADEMLVDFPEMVMKRCVSLLCDTPSSDDSIPLFAAFITTLSLTQSPISPLSALTEILQFAKQTIEKQFNSLSVHSLLHSITCVHSLLQSFIQLYEAPEDVVTPLFQQFPPSWRDQIRDDLFRSLQNWIEEAFEQISQSSREFIEQIQSIGQLASIKREVRQVSEDIHDSWLHALSVILQGSVSDPIERLFTMLFRDQSIAIIHACFETLQHTLQERMQSVIQVPRKDLGATVKETLQKPLFQLYHDLTDLEYFASSELVRIVAEESKQLFATLLGIVPREGDFLSIAFVEYVVYQSIQQITTTQRVDLAILAEPFFEAFKADASHWIAEQMNPTPMLQLYLQSFKWTMRDTEWYEAVSGWKEYSLGSIEEAQEELISVPGSCSACCLQLLLRLCEHLDQASLLSKESTFTQQIHTLFVSTAYQAIAHSYQTLITSLLNETPVIASPGLLLLLFDVLFLERFVQGSQVQLNEIAQMLDSVKNQVIEMMDPVDWTLAESFVKKALDECISSVALLLGLLLPPTYDLHGNMMIKSLSRNDNIIFTPIEKLTSYPISSQSMQLLLQSHMKDYLVVF